MSRYVARRLLFAVPTLLVISFIVFALLDLAPSDPTAQLPLTIPPETRQVIRESLGLGQPFHIRYLKWLDQFLVSEPAGRERSRFDAGCAALPEDRIYANDTALNVMAVAREMLYGEVAYHKGYHEAGPPAGGRPSQRPPALQRAPAVDASAPPRPRRPVAGAGTTG